MAILSIKERFQQTKKGKSALTKLKQQHKKSGSSIDWTKNRPGLDLTKDLIPISSLHIDESTQRSPFSDRRLKKLLKIVSNPCSRKFKRIIVSNRKYMKGSQQFTVVNGQGRVLAAYAMGETAVPYDLYTFNSKWEEANFFLDQGKNVDSIKLWEKHSVTLNVPDARGYTQSLDLEKIISATEIEYDPEKINKVDASGCYAGIRDSMTRSERNDKDKELNGQKTKVAAGTRTGAVPIGIIKLLIKYCSKPNETLVLYSSLFYPMTEYVLGFKKNTVGLRKLEERIESLKKKNNGNIEQDDLIDTLGLRIYKNMKDKRQTSSKIPKKW